MQQNIVDLSFDEPLMHKELTKENGDWFNCQKTEEFLQLIGYT